MAETPTPKSGEVPGTPTLLQGTKKAAVLRALGVVASLAVTNATSAMRLAGVTFTTGARPAQSDRARVRLASVDQTIISAQDGDGYHRRRRGPLRTTGPLGCDLHRALHRAASLVFEGLSLQKTLIAGRKIIERPSCWP